MICMKPNQYLSFTVIHLLDSRIPLLLWQELLSFYFFVTKRSVCNFQVKLLSLSLFQVLESCGFVRNIKFSTSSSKDLELPFGAKNGVPMDPWWPPQSFKLIAPLWKIINVAISVSCPKAHSTPSIGKNGTDILTLRRLKPSWRKSVITPTVFIYGAKWVGNDPWEDTTHTPLWLKSTVQWPLLKWTSNPICPPGIK